MLPTIVSDVACTLVAVSIESSNTEHKRPLIDSIPINCT
jgi:hypothetical protein